MTRSESPSLLGTRRYAWEGDEDDDSRSPSRARHSGRRRRRKKRRSPSDSPPRRKRGRRDPSRSRSRGGGGGGGGGKGGGGKGKMCWDYINKRCKRGDGCTLSHDNEERRRLLDTFKQQPCKQGSRCTRPGCFYGHPGDELRKRERSESSESSVQEVKIPMIKAVGLKSYGEFPVLEDLRIPKPVLDVKGKDLLVRIHGIDMNPLSLRKGAGGITTELTPYGLSSGLSGDRVLASSAGFIEELSDEARTSGKFKVGDAVWFAESWDSTKDSIQEYCLVDYRLTALKPNILSFADAASIPLAALTAWPAMIERMSLDVHLLNNGIRLPRFTPQNKGVFLALPGAGAAGSFALQLAARYLNKNNNLTVIASASKPESVEWCKKMGAVHVINHEAYSYKDELDKIGIKGLDYVFYGTPPQRYEEKLYEVMNPLGQIASYHEGDFEKRDACLPKRIALHRERIGLKKFLEVDGEVLAAVARLFDDPTVGLESVVTQRYSELSAETARQAQTWYTVRSIDVDATGTAVFEIK